MLRRIVEHAFTPAVTSLASNSAISGITYGLRITSAPIPTVGSQE